MGTLLFNKIFRTECCVNLLNDFHCLVQFILFSWCKGTCFYLQNHCLSNPNVNFCQVVEIGKGNKVKYELDKTSGLIKVCVFFPFWLILQPSNSYQRYSCLNALSTVASLLVGLFTLDWNTYVLYFFTKSWSSWNFSPMLKIQPDAIPWNFGC